MNSIRKIIAGLLLCAGICTAQAATIHVPNSFLYDAVTGAIDVNTDTIKCGLVTSAYTYNRDTHTKYSDITNEVATGGGYTAGGQTASVTVTNNTTSDKLVIVIDPADYAGSTTITARQVFCYKSRGGLASADELIVFADQGADVSSAGGTFTIAPITIEYTNF